MNFVLMLLYKYHTYIHKNQNTFCIHQIETQIAKLINTILLYQGSSFISLNVDVHFTKLRFLTLPHN